MAELVLGPALRYVDETSATVWVETDAPCEVKVLDGSAKTFTVAGHHYALVCISGLEPGSINEYQVHLDGERRWPLADSTFPPSVIRTPHPDEPARIAFGSCRVCVPHEPPYAVRKDDDDRGREVDALYALALRMRDTPMDQWPTRLLMLGDQVYADEVSPRTCEFIRSRRDISEPPGEQIADFEEYTRLYWEAWGEPVMRWLLSTVATAMIFDDHDVHDDWNISGEWLEDWRAKPWWDKRIRGAFMTYWIYQHIGNLPPDELSSDEMYDRVCQGDGDMADALSDFAHKADREVDGTRWSFARDYGGVRVIVVDSRAGRDFRDGRRCMLDDDEFDWLDEQLTGGEYDHLVIASSLPLLLGHGMHELEAWNEAICAGAWGRPGKWIGEKIRRGLDLEHWAAFGESFKHFMRRIEEVGSGRHGRPPASITILSGDVHHAYLAEVAFRKTSNVESPVYQAVCSPFRNPLDDRERAVVKFGWTKTSHAIGRALSHAAGVRAPDVRWRLVDGPWFDNQVATLELHNREASLRIERTQADEWRDPKLHECFTTRLA